jgi:hypothetical protein
MNRRLDHWHDKRFQLIASSFDPQGNLLQALDCPVITWIAKGRRSRLVIN